MVGRIRIRKPMLFDKPIPDYILERSSRFSLPVKVGNRRGWKSKLDWDVSGCHPITRDLLTFTEDELRDWHSEQIKAGISRNPIPEAGKTANQIRQENSEKLVREIAEKYSGLFQTNHTNSWIADRISKRMKSTKTLPPELRTLRKYVAIIKSWHGQI